jgi:ABC-type multidrug transport system ATPase subunit
LERDKVILLTTHHLEEAEILSDFIVVLSRGQAVESGTLHQLKIKFAVGNQIKLTKKNDSNSKNLIKNAVEEKEFILNSVSEDMKAKLEEIEFQHFDSYSLVLKTGRIPNAELVEIIQELSQAVDSHFYISINSCTFDDIFREIDRIYEQGSGGDEDLKMRKIFGKFINFLKSKFG